MRQTFTFGTLLVFALVSWSTVAESPSSGSAKAKIDLEAAVGWDLTNPLSPQRHSEVESTSTYPGQGVIDPPVTRSQSLYPGGGRHVELTSMTIWPFAGGTNYVDSMNSWPGWVELLEFSPASLATPSGLVIGKSALAGAGPIPTRDGRLFLPVELLMTP